VPLIPVSNLRLLREVVHTFLEGVPRHLELEEVGHSMAGVAGVPSVHGLHIWSLSSEKTALSAHVVLQRIEEWQPLHARLRKLLAERYGIEHVTLQPEPVETVLSLGRPARKRRETATADG
jgi:cobalt-zinc-cadmium efflux system protein